MDSADEKAKNGVDRWQPEIDGYIRRIEANPAYTKANKALIKDFVAHYLKSRNAKPRTMLRYVYTYSKLLECMPSKKLDILKATRKQLEECVANINALNVGSETKTKIKITLKVLFKWHYGEVDERGKFLFTPKEVAFISTTSDYENGMTWEDLPSEEDIKKLLKNCLNTRDFFLISLITDAPLRTHEIIALKRKHLQLGKNPALIIPTGTNTGSRRIPLINCIGAASRYVETAKLDPEDPLFLHELWNKEKKPMTVDGLRAMLHKVALRAGVNPKKCYPYAFRHRWCSIMASKISNASLEAAAGWAPGTAMHRIYQQMHPDAASDEIRIAYGMKPREETVLKVTEQVCQCGNINPANAVHCSKCGNYLNQDIAITNMSKDAENAGYVISKAIKEGNLEAVEVLLSQLILKEDAKRKKQNR